MIIYLEGPDASGKSTLRTKIFERLNQIQEELKTFGVATFVENGEDLIPTRPTNSNRLTLVNLVSKFFEMANDLTTIYICDRGPISDIIYRAFDKFQPVMTLNQYITVWIQCHSLVITVHCDSDASIEMLHERGDNNPIAVANHAAIRYLYKQIMPIFKPLKYDFSLSGNKDYTLNKISWMVANLLSGLEKVKYERDTKKNIEDELKGE